jgi:hypothetical protein
MKLECGNGLGVWDVTGSVTSIITVAMMTGAYLYQCRYGKPLFYSQQGMLFGIT